MNIHKIDLNLKASNTFNITCFFKKHEKKELSSNDYLKLFGQLSLLCLYNIDELELYGLTMHEVINDSAISDNELYLNGFEGYDISDRLNIKSLYLNKHDCVIVSVYDNKFDRFLDFVL